MCSHGIHCNEFQTYPHYAILRVRNQEMAQEYIIGIVDLKLERIEDGFLQEELLNIDDIPDWLMERYLSYRRETSF